MMFFVLQGSIYKLNVELSQPALEQSVNAAASESCYYMFHLRPFSAKILIYKSYRLNTTFAGRLL
ncbi:hypothetical protein [uncultured Paraglaciecola sp.]|uniref:hypothetical protein n=1 Tax=uncultured Paraglaciecola sp. TaxID=1765024 RepID=UPI0030DB573A|tara:strand:+ start:2439 stop:2633 length:195 start_codon:yes stop_codon:yes gene_type:complete